MARTHAHGLLRWCIGCMLVLAALGASGIARAQASPACSITLGDAVLDLGSMAPVATGLQRVLPVRSVPVTVACTATADLTLSYAAPQAADPTRFALGDAGSLGLRMRDVIVDGQPVALGAVHAAGGAIDRHAASMALTPTSGVVPVRDGVALSGTSMSALIDVDVLLQPQGAPGAAHLASHGEFVLGVHAATMSFDVVALIEPGSCTLQLTNGGIVNLGQVDYGRLAESVPTPLPEQSIGVNIACGAPMRVALKAIENRQGTSVGSDGRAFGLGLTRGGGKIGAFKLAARDAVADGTAAAFLGSTDMLAWTPRTDLSPVGDVYTGLETAAGGVGTIGALTTARFSLVVAPVIASRRTIGGIGGVEPIDGSVTLELVYP